MDFWEQYSACLREARKKRRWGLSEDVRVHVLQAPPFRACPDDSIWDTHLTPPKAFVCQDRPRLVLQLSSFLFDSELFRVQADVIPQEMLARTREMLRYLHEMRGFFTHQRQRRTLSPSAQTAIAGMKLYTLEHACQKITHVFGNLTIDDYDRYATIVREHVQP